MQWPQVLLLLTAAILMACPLQLSAFCASPSVSLSPSIPKIRSTSASRVLDVGARGLRATKSAGYGPIKLLF